MRKISKLRRGDRLFAYALLIPTVIYLACVFVYPIVQSLFWSFLHYDLLDGSPKHFVGFGNYAQILVSGQFWYSLWNAIWFTLFTCSVELVLGFFCALLLNQTFPGRTFFRASIIIPWALLTMVNGLLWDYMLQPGTNGGALQIVLHALHLLPHNSNPVWLATITGTVFWAGIADIWKMTPFMTLLILAGLQSLPGELYEASMLDGAGFWKKVRYVTIPHVMPAVIVAVVLRVMGAFRVYDILTEFTGSDTTSVTYLTFDNAFRYFYLGKASAMAWLSTLFIIALIIYYIRILKKNMDEA
ncbi:carbohydrate ABC transporter permease [Alicyclobacillus fastidiosus]|uniref:Sugar ABC transporter permease n=1 Tax=Alicyclobacillus fastidiosus TaxID=392011 RepID=A0ABV5A8Y4_9BACL|nr:sugar ABC transporter permease [Alicyclobacillus fastidiosus]WEH10690.1 sugar ABC transporter permease [Alicyclobacillus fastidiosus]